MSNLNQNPSMSDILAQLNALKAENEALKAKGTGTRKAAAVARSQRGHVMINITGRKGWPLLLAKDEVINLFKMKEEIMNFITQNDGSLPVASAIPPKAQA